VTAAHGIRLAICKEPRQEQLERDIVQILRENYEDEFGEPSKDLLTAALEMMPETVPLDRQEALVEQLAVLGESIRLSNDDEDSLAAIAAESYGRERTRTGLTLGLRANSPPMIFTVEDEAAVAWLGEETPFWIGKHYSEDLSGVIRRVAMEQGLVEGLDVREVGAAMERVLGGTFARTESYWNLLATNAVTRARNFGFVGTAGEAGLVEAEVLAMMDGRTSEQCRILDGTIYRIPDLTAQRTAMIGATPEEAVKIAAWRKPDEIRDLSASELVALGVAIPPYHGNCRTILIVR